MISLKKACSVHHRLVWTLNSIKKKYNQTYLWQHLKFIQIPPSFKYLLSLSPLHTALTIYTNLIVAAALLKSSSPVEKHNFTVRYY